MIVIRNIQQNDLRHLLWNESLLKMKSLEELNFERFKSKRLLWVIAESDGIAVGQVKAKDLDKSELCIFALRVRDDMQNTGIGSKLMKAIESLIKEKGHKSISVSVDIENIDAKRLYERLGYMTGETLREIWEYANEDGTIGEVGLMVHKMHKKL